jgi:gliding motility-associated-like protein
VPGPVGSFSFAPTAGCNPLKVCFHETSINAQNYTWDFGDGIVLQAKGGDTCHVYTNPGNFHPVLLLGNTLPNGLPCQLPATNLTGSVTVTNVINVSINGPHIVHVPLDSIISVTTNYSGGLPPYNFHWSPDTGLSCTNCTSVLIMGLGDTMVYTFAIYDTAGCKGVDSILILSEPCFQKKLIPNVFSPNGDGINDMFYIPGVCPYEKYSLQIFDRWGTLMFTSTQRNNGWDGKTTAGEEAPDGVYYFIVKIAGQVDKKAHALPDSTYKGFVQLVR